MNNLIFLNSDFLRLFIKTQDAQRRALIKSITDQQMRALVQIVYNILIGNRSLTRNMVSRLSAFKGMFRKFVNPDIANDKRKLMLYKYRNQILQMLFIIRSELK